MADYLIDDIAAACGGEVHFASDKRTIRHIIIDSRKFSFPAESIFIAIKGERHDGHKYLDDLYRQHVRNFLVSRLPANLHEFKSCNFVLVEDTLIALQQIAAMHRSFFSIPVIGITGSNGKTILKEWLFQLIFKDRVVLRSPKSYNSQVGVPLSVWQLDPIHELALFEAGISKPGEMKYLEKIIKPDIGVITNIGQAHQEHFNSLEHKLAEKLELFNSSGVLVYCKDHRIIDDYIRNSEVHSRIRHFTWATSGEADLIIHGEDRHSFQTIINASFRGRKLSVTIPFTDKASVENGIHALAVLLLLGYHDDFIKDNMPNLTPVAMRLEQKQGINNCTVINDSYNSDPGSLEIAMDFLSQQSQHNKKRIILSDIFETGRGHNELYREIGELLNREQISHFTGVGTDVKKIKEFLYCDHEFYDSTDDYLREFDPKQYNDEAILLKGSRKFEFERISLLLEEKAHATVLEINLNGLTDNFNYFKSRLASGTGIMAVVKAFSYGSGSYQIANILAHNRVDYLAVAFIDEGVSLRKAGISTPIMVMNPDFSGYSLMVDNLLEPEIYNFGGLDVLIEKLKSKGINNYPVHIKLETGMHRLGFSQKDIPFLLKALSGNMLVRVRSLFSHLAAAEDPDHDKFTIEQIELFGKISEEIMGYLDYPVLRHILNSAGIERFPDAQFDMVRLGIGMYGVSSLKNNKLANVSTFKSLISQIKNVKAGLTVGYSRAWKAAADSRIAIVPVGYADGLDRRLGNGRGRMIINGTAVPVIGNICMDMCMLDVTGIVANEGDEVIVFGEENPITEIAGLLSTIPYEVFTSISARVKRVYIHE